MNISYILSQHIHRIDIIIINKKNICKQHQDLKKVYTHIYIYIKASLAIRMFTYKKYICPQASATPRYKIGSLAYIQSKRHTIYIHQGASIAPPAAPPSGGGGGPPPPAPGDGGGTPAGPSCPGGRCPLVIAASTTARRTIPRHGGGNPMHCSRNPSSWIWIHIPSGTSCNTVSRQRHISSKSTPAATRGACDGPAPGSPNQRLLAALSGSAGRPAASSR